MTVALAPRGLCLFVSAGRLAHSWHTSIILGLRGREAAHVDLAGDGGGDEGAAAFLQEGDGGLGFVD